MVVRPRPGGRLRCHPPVHSPIPAGAIARAIAGAFVGATSKDRSGDGTRPDRDANHTLGSDTRTDPGARHTPRADPRHQLRARLLIDYRARECALCASGTDALRIALEIAGRRSNGAPVALPAFACYDIATAAVGAGAPVLFYDIDPATLSPDLDSLERALRAGARSIVAAPLYGIPIDWAAIHELAARHGALLIEDAAQGHGAFWHGRPLGSLGTLAVLSFGRGKGWTGGGGGALLLARDADSELADAFAQRMEALETSTRSRTAGARILLKAVAQCALARPTLYGLPRAIPGLHLGRTVYRHPSPPSPMPRAAAALLEATHDAACAEAAARRRIARRYLQALDASTPATPIHPPADTAPGYLRLPLRLPSGLASLADPRAAQRFGIAPSYPTPLPDLPPIRPLLAAPPAPHPGAATLARQLLTLPTHSRLTAAEQQEVLRHLHASAA